MDSQVIQQTARSLSYFINILYYLNPYFDNIGYSVRHWAHFYLIVLGKRSLQISKTNLIRMTKNSKDRFFMVIHLSRLISGSLNQPNYLQNWHLTNSVVTCKLTDISKLTLKGFCRWNITISNRCTVHELCPLSSILNGVFLNVTRVENPRPWCPFCNWILLKCKVTHLNKIH